MVFEHNIKYNLITMKSKKLNDLHLFELTFSPLYNKLNAKCRSSFNNVLT